MLGGGTAHIDSLIERLRNTYNIISVVATYGENTYSTMTRFFTTALDIESFEANSTLYTSRVEAIVSFSTYLLGGSSSAKVNSLLKFLNVPVLRGVIINTRTTGDWVVSSEGVTPWSRDDIMGQAGFPETRGLIESIIIAAAEFQSDSLTGAYTYSYSPLPDRIEKLAERLTSWVNLRLTPSSEKKIAIIYYNYPPGKSEIGASYLNVPETVLYILERLKVEGYITGETPRDVDELVSMMLDRGHNVAGWTPGILEILADKAILWDADEYIAWFNNLNPIAKKQMVEGPVGYIEEITKLANQAGEKKEIITRIDKWKVDMVSTINDVITDTVQSQSCIELLIKMSDALKATVNGNNTVWADFYNAKNAFMAYDIPALTGWGEPPGNLMTVTRNGKQYIVIPGLFFGNIFVGPEPLRGWEADESKLYHSTVLPLHQFLAVYAWLENVYGANAEIHVGTHARFEWTPGKQTALADYDYPDITISNVPSPYIYIVDNIAEGQQAKRRGLSVLINHLTPPIKVTELYSEL